MKHEIIMVDPAQPVGPQLGARRKALRLGLAQVEIDTKIRGKFLTVIESGDYASLPNDVYSRGFVQRYASYLGLDGNLAAAAYAAERGGIDQGRTARPRLERPKRLVFTGPIVAVLSILAVAAGVALYLGVQFAALAAAPRLDVTSPETDASLTGSILDVSGSATPGTDVTVNDSPVVSGTDGAFTEKVTLRDGINTIRVRATSKLGKATTITRSVLALVPATDQGVAAVPTAPIDGVAVGVAVSKTTALVIVADGREVWRGTMLAGTARVFGGAGTGAVSITTGNAGATSLTVTNAVAAGKRIERLGGDGEVRRDQAFARDTVLP